MDKNDDEKSEEIYDNFGDSDILLIEENLCYTISSKCKWISDQYWPDKTVSNPLEQIIDNANFHGNRSYTNNTIKCKQIENITSKMVNIMSPSIWGGFDFFVPDNDDNNDNNDNNLNNIYLVDINTARICSSHAVLYLSEKWNIKYFANSYFKVNKDRMISYKNFKKLLVNFKILFNKNNKCGVIPLVYSPIINRWQFCVFADTEFELNQYLETMNMILQKWWIEHARSTNLIFFLFLYFAFFFVVVSFLK